MEIWKYLNLKIVEIFNSKIMYVSRLKCMTYVCIYVCMFVDKYQCLCVY